jgi:ELWxxDGT repeat protein
MEKKANIFTFARAILASAGMVCIAAAQAPVFVGDLNAFPNHARQVEELVVHDGRIFFHAETGQSSAELGSISITDGSYRFERDLAPASLSAPMASDGPLYYIRQTYENYLYHYRIAAHHDSGQSAWLGPRVYGLPYRQPDSIATVGSLAFFPKLPDGSHPSGLFVTDGTDNGTMLVHAAQQVLPFSVRSLGGRVLFLDMESSIRLWSADPTTMKSSLLLDFAGSHPSIGWNGVVDGEYWIVANHSCDQITLVRTGGLPANTQQRIFDLDSPCFGAPEHVVIHQGDAYLGGKQILRLNFSSGAVEQVLGACEGCRFRRLTSAGNSLIYESRWGSGEQTALFRLDSSGDGFLPEPILHQGKPVLVSTYPLLNKAFYVLGERVLTNCLEGACTSQASDDSLEILGDGLVILDEQVGVTKTDSHWYFSGVSGMNSGIWRSDGRKSGTSLLHPIASQTVSAYPNGPPAIGAWVGETVVLAGTNVCEFPWDPCGSGIARSDGTAAGTRAIDSPFGRFAHLFSMHNFGDRVLAGTTGDNGHVLFSMSPDLDDVRVLAGPETGMGSFVMTNAERDPDFALWGCGDIFNRNVCAQATDGASPERILPDGPCSSLGPSALGTINGRALFSTDPCGIGPRQLWSSGGTRLSTYIIPGVSSANAPATAFGKHLYFMGSNEQGGGLWRTDGGPASAEHVPGTSGLIEKLVTGSLLYFQTTNGGQREVWRSDGTTQGTYPLRTANEVIDLKAVGDYAHWIEWANFRSTYWVSDGTVAGTFQVPEHSTLIPAGNIFELPRVLKEDSPAGWSGVFACDSLELGRELCGIRADGSGLGLAADITKGERGSHPAGFMTNGSKVFFVANDSRYGNELHDLRSETMFRSGFGY